MLLSDILNRCLGCEPMGSMCAKQTTTNPDYLEHPNRQMQNDKKQEEAQPLVDDQMYQNKDNHQNDQINELIPAANQDKKERSRSPSPSTDEYEAEEEEDKQLLHDAIDIIQDAEQLNSDDNNSGHSDQIEYSKKDEDIQSDITIPYNDKKSEEKKEEKQDEDEQENDEKEEKELEEILIDPKYALPLNLGGIPAESMEQMDSEDRKMASQLSAKYAHLLSKYSSVEKMNFIFRYTIGYKHIKKKKRMATVCADIDYFFEMYERYDLDNIINTQSTPQELDAWKQFLYGEDKYGHPVMYDLIGSSDCKKMQKVFMQKNKNTPFGEAVYLHVFRFMRKVENYKRQNTLKYGKQIHKQIQVMDMAGFTSEHLKGKNRKITKLVINTLTRMFPEGTYKMYIINAPWPFRASWSIVKGFLDEITVQKTKVLGEDYLKEMIKDIPIEMIPQQYGGKGVWQRQYGTIPKNYDIDILHGLD